ncbi:MAG: GIY-YIG nuclease family protein [Candidatus Bathyarchaeota archaeon]|nr:MAG: GIY-YIG nuclease family protein [Candidatus Bathyarchaeota archaeon]
MVKKGVYCLAITVEEPVDITVGALGRLEFLSGSYVYVGSALNGIEARLRRHIKTSRGRGETTHWHIDYLLRAPEVEIEDLFVKLTDLREECEFADSVSELGKPTKGFGCSDCRCVSHLFRVEGFDFLPRLGLKPFYLD